MFSNAFSVLPTISNPAISDAMRPTNATVFIPIKVGNATARKLIKSSSSSTS